MEGFATGFSPTTQDLKIQQDNASTNQDVPSLAMSHVMYKIGTVRGWVFLRDQNFT